MRLWSLHPCLLDSRGLVALWREGLLAQKVLAGETKGYKHHPHLARFRACPDPMAAIGQYLVVVAGEASARGYRFAVEKIANPAGSCQVLVTQGQLEFEHAHLKAKLARRDPDRLKTLPPASAVPVHPMFRVVPGGVEPWEKV